MDNVRTSIGETIVFNVDSTCKGIAVPESVAATSGVAITGTTKTGPTSNGVQNSWTWDAGQVSKVSITVAGTSLSFIEFSDGASVTRLFALATGGGRPNPSADSGLATAQPVAESLSLSVGSSGSTSETCTTGSSVTGYAGEWLTLPSAADCSLPSRSSAKLLGWSTSAEFPVSIAQRQVDNGWGTYELTNDAGQVTAVFIPAGRSAYVSASNTLHPIWSA